MTSNGIVAEELDFEVETESERLMAILRKIARLSEGVDFDTYTRAGREAMDAAKKEASK